MTARNPSDDESQTKEQTVHQRNIRTGDRTPQSELVHAAADLKDADMERLSPLYPQIDSLVDQLFTSPPPAAAQAQVEFTWEGFRITVYHDGTAIFQAEAQDAE